MDDRRVIEVNIEEEMKKSYLAYSMSVIMARALPDVRDGLKPVHRRILFAMKELGIEFNKPYKKSARIVGEVLGKYHPHGDSAVYDAIVRMVQDFSLRYPLIDGQGNFGSIDGDSAAAMRYTEIRFKKIAGMFLQDIEKETVDFRPNFDETLQEPIILPAVIPNVLLNGSSGIAVGMATNIPPHNLNELVAATIELIDNPEIEILDLIKYVKGPDFPTGGTIVGSSGITDCYLTGRGKMTLRAKSNIEITEKNRERIIINEIPYQVNKANLLQQIAHLVKDKKIDGISDIRDESDRDGIRIVIDLKRDAEPKVVINNLLKHSNLQVTFGAIMLVLVDQEPKILNIKEILNEFIKFRHEIIIRRTQFDLAKAEKKAHILEGLKIALENIDRVIEIIKKSPNTPEANKRLMTTFSLSEAQSKAILDMRLHRLTALETEKIEQEYLDTIKLINRLKEILDNRSIQMQIIKDELLAAKKEYGDERRTDIIPDENSDFDIEQLIAEENVVVTITHNGYIKRTAIDSYKIQRRGGRGVAGMNTNEDDYVQHLFIASTHDHLLIFTSHGKVYSIKVHTIPEAGRTSKGKAIINLIEISKNEKIKAFMSIREFSENSYITMSTKLGMIKKTSLDQFANIRRGGIIAIKIDENDSLIDCQLTNGSMEIIIATHEGKAIRFNEMQTRSMGRNTHGVKAIRLDKTDHVIGMIASKGENSLLTVTEKGFGKRSLIDDYRITNRGGKGVINIKIDPNRGKVVAIREITNDDELMLITKNGILIRTLVKQIPTVGRNSKGVRMINLQEDDQLIDITPIVTENENL